MSTTDNLDFLKSRKDENKEAEATQKMEIRRLKEEITSMKEDREMRKSLSVQIINFFSVYMFCVFFLLLLTGMPCHFHLSDAVLITILGTTTANIIGVLVIVVTYYFHKSKQ